MDTRDDAGVFRISENSALVQTIDFFTPVVDDPYDYGQIAVANSLSDIYAMGAKPLTALNVVGFPIATMDKKILAQIILGGYEKVKEAGVALLGGHSIKDPEIKFGLAVTAMADPQKIVRNNTAHAGDKLILTKPLGAGILTTALKYERLPDSLLDTVTAVMKKLNRTSSEVMLQHGVTACTDVTGFGFLGHLYEMMTGSHKSATIFTNRLPLFPDILQYVIKENLPGGLKENRKFLKPFLKIPEDFDERVLNLLCDPQTSGGLLFTIPAGHAQACLRQLHDLGENDAQIVGEISHRTEFPIHLQ